MGKRKLYRVNMKHLFQTLFERRWDDRGQFIETMASALARERTNFLEFVDRQLQDMPEERRDELGELYAEDYQNLEEDYPRFLWQGVFLTLYTLFEQQMNELCTRVRRTAKKKGISEKTAPKGNHCSLPGTPGLRKLGVVLPVSSPLWRKMSRLKSARNLIVHNGGLLRRDASSDDVKMLCRGNQNIQIEGDQVIIGREFCAEALGVMRNIVLKAVTKVPEKFWT
jgi:hypothetical protein